MREILFRGKTVKKPDGNEFNEVWVEGDLISAAGHWYIHPRSNWFDMTGEIAKLVCLHEVDPSTVGQYTGLKDKNGKMIYEGDIVEGPDFDEEDGYAVIKWDDDTARFIVTGRYLTVDFDNYWGRDLEVIGNIHDNPELLGGAENG